MAVEIQHSQPAPGWVITGGRSREFECTNGVDEMIQTSTHEAACQATWFVELTEPDPWKDLESIDAHDDMLPMYVVLHQLSGDNDSSAEGKSRWDFQAERELMRRGLVRMAACIQLTARGVAAINAAKASTRFGPWYVYIGTASL